MPIKKIKYTRDELDVRVGKSHDHNNKSVLDNITEELLNKIDNSASKDLKNVAAADIKAALEKSGMPFTEDVKSDGNSYVREAGKWNTLDSKLTQQILSSNDGTIKISGTALNRNVDISDTWQKKITDNEKALTNKLSRPSDATVNNLISFNANKDAEDSGISKANVILSTNLATNIKDEESSTTKAVSVKAAKNMFDELSEAVSGSGRYRGSVCNAFTSVNNTISIPNDDYMLMASATSIGGGIPNYTYAEGDIVTIYSDIGCITPSTAIIDSVRSDGSIRTMTILDGGKFDSNVVTTSTDFYIYGRRVGNNRYIFQSLSLTKLPTSDAATTLSSIQNPIVGDTCYVYNDETQNNISAMYRYSTISTSEVVGRDIKDWICISAYGTSIFRV